MRKYTLVNDKAGLSIFIILVIVVVAILIVAIIAVAYVGRDDLGDRVTEDDIAVIYAQGTVDIRDCDIFGLANFLGYFIDAIIDGARLDLDTRVEYDIHDDDDDNLRPWQFYPAGLFDKSVDIKCKIRCTGPGDYDDTAKSTKRVTLNILYESKTVEFNEMQFPVEKAGIYKIVMTVTVDDEHVGDKTSSITISGGGQT